MTTASPPNPAQQAAARSAAQRVADKLEKPGTITRAFGLLIYGRTKSGKTSLLSTLPGKGFIIDVRRKEGGTNVLAPHTDRMDVYPILKWQELDDVMAYLADPKHKYDWVALDTITGLLSLAEEATIGRMASFSSVPRQMKGSEWGTMGGRIIRLLDSLHEMNMVSIILAQEKRREVPDLGNVCAPDVIPMLLTPLTEPMTLIGHLSVANIGDKTTPIMEHQLRIKAHPSYYTGCRVDIKQAESMPDVVKNPNLKDLVNFIYRRGEGGKLEPATIPVAAGGLALDDDAE